MKTQTENNQEQKKVKKNNDSAIITKESVTAVCALFSIFALTLLFTDKLIFGEIGGIICDFLLGVFGYCAYPFFFWATAISFIAFCDTKLFSNRKAAILAVCSVFFLLLIIQTAVTYSMPIEGYSAACFEQGQEFSTATLTGFIGGSLIFIIATLLTKIGTIVLFSLLFLFFAYLTLSAIGVKALLKRREAKAAEPKQDRSVSPTTQQSLPQQNSGFPQAVYGQAAPTTMQQSSNYPPRVNTIDAMQESEIAYGGNPQAYFTPSVYQRPQFSLDDSGVSSYKPSQESQSNVNDGAFSPFGLFEQNKYRSTGSAPQTSKQEEITNAKEFLFSESSAEMYRKNLIFDRNANVNKRPSPVVEPPYFGGNVGSFTSYTNVYENSVNQNVRPEKIVNDRVTIERSSYEQPIDRNEDVAPIQEPERTPAQNKNISRGRYEDESNLFGVDANRTTVETPSDNRLSGERRVDSEGYQRHEYMNLFSTSNPNIFGDGRGQEDNRINEKPGKEGANGVFSRDTNDRNGIFERSANLDFGRKPEEKEGFDAEENINDALNIFDDDLDEPKDFLGTAPMQTENIRERSESRDRLFPMQDPGRNMGLNSISFKEEREEPKKEIIPPKPIAPPPPPKPRIRRPYRPAPIDYFDCRDVEVDDDMMEVETAKDTILDVLHNYGITEATIASVTFGPTITRYNVVVPRNVSPKKLVSSEMEIAMAMNLHASKGVNIYPNFEDGAISLEVPKKNRQTVQLGCMLTGDQYVNAKPTSLVFSMGKDVGNKKVYGDICKMVHLLVAGSTGSGKSVFLSTLIISLINRYSPDQLRLILIDPKKTEFVIYHDLPHLMVNEIITDPRKAIQSLNWAIGEMNRRYELFAEMGRKGTYVVNVDEYNAQLKDGEEKLPKIVIVVDELADLMLAAKKEVEDRIQNLTQKSRAAGIHLIIATQRPSADVITGVIKANLATRIAFMVATDVDSRVILDASGAQKLLGYGDMMYTMSGVVTPIRVQSAFISSTDSQKVIDYIRMNNEAYFDEAASNYINNARAVSDDGGMGDMGSESGVEEVYIEALKFVILSGSASISMIQRKCSVGYNKAGKIVEWMEDMGYISAFDGAKARKVLISKEEFESKYGPLN